MYARRKGHCRRRDPRDDRPPPSRKRHRPSGHRSQRLELPTPRQTKGGSRTNQPTRPRSFQPAKTAQHSTGLDSPSTTTTTPTTLSLPTSTSTTTGPEAASTIPLAIRNLSGRIAYHSSRDGGTGIYIHDPDSEIRLRVTDNTDYDGHPVWSPDGRRIAYFAYRNGDYEIYIFDLDANIERQITVDIGRRRRGTGVVPLGSSTVAQALTRHL